MDSNDTGGPHVLDRYASLLAILAESNEPLAVPQLARRADLPTSSTYRLLQALEQHELIERNGHQGVSLGLRVLELAGAVEHRLEVELLAPARPLLERLAAHTRETVLLTVPVGTNALGLASFDSPRPFRLTYAAGRTAPIHQGASGKVLLAFLSDRRRERVLYKLATRDDAVDITALRRQLAAIRKRGYVVTNAELDEGARGIAAPILGPRRQLVAGITVAGPIDRLAAAERDLIEQTLSTAAQIGPRLRARGGGR